MAILALAFPASLAGDGCRGEPPPEVQLVLPDSSGPRWLVPRASLVEYARLAGGNELRITLADHAIPCGRYTVPAPGEIRVMIRIAVPPGVIPSATAYSWLGDDPSPEGRIERALAAPKVYVGARSYLFKPGGGARLSEVSLVPGGTVAGVLGFEYPGDGTHPATSIKGAFRAKLCSPERDGSAALPQGGR